MIAGGPVPEPWGGKSPRSLTRAAMALFSRREPQKSMSELKLVVAREFDRSKKGPPRYEGAQLLLPLEDYDGEI